MQDEVGLEGGWNPYAYAGNDPVNHIDPDGKMFLRSALVAAIERLTAKEAIKQSVKQEIKQEVKQEVKNQKALPRDKHGNPVPDSEYPHTQLGSKKGRNGDYLQAREWGYNDKGKLEPKRDIDFTDHGRPQNHPNPHQHDFISNPTGGTPKHGPAKPLEKP